MIRGVKSDWVRYKMNVKMEMVQAVSNSLNIWNLYETLLLKRVMSVSMGAGALEEILWFD